MPDGDAPAAAPGRDTARAVAATAIGNGLMIYDFTVYSFSAVFIGQHFFPAGNALASLLMALATFGAGFFMRPLGALVIGSLADRRGRKAAMLASIAIMTLGTGIIAFTPSYATIGVGATWLIVLARLMQGFAAGGEIGAASAMLMELASRERRCYLVSWRAASQGLSAMAGALVGALGVALLTPSQMQDWGWRVSFMLGLPIGLVGWYIRRHLTEAPMRANPRAPLARVLRQHRRTLWFGTLAMAAPTASIYIVVFYMPTYLVRTLHMAPSISLLSASLAGAMIFLATPALALVADRQRRRKPIQYATLLCCAILVYPAFHVLTHAAGEGLALAVIVAYAVLALSNGGASGTMLLEAFPRQHRALGMGIIYSMGSALFGGFSPLIVTWLIAATGNPMAPAWYLLAALATSLYALRRFPDTVEAQ